MCFTLRENGLDFDWWCFGLSRASQDKCAPIVFGSNIALLRFFLFKKSVSGNSPSLVSLDIPYRIEIY